MDRLPIKQHRPNGQHFWHHIRQNDSIGNTAPESQHKWYTSSSPFVHAVSFDVLVLRNVRSKASWTDFYQEWTVDAEKSWWSTHVSFATTLDCHNSISCGQCHDSYDSIILSFHHFQYFGTFLFVTLWSSVVNWQDPPGKVDSVVVVMNTRGANLA